MGSIALSPCYFIQEALKALLKCLGYESYNTIEESSIPQATEIYSPESAPNYSSSTTTNVVSDTHTLSYVYMLMYVFIFNSCKI